MKRLLSILASFAAALTFAQPVPAQQFVPDPVDEAAARREGSVSWYTSGNLLPAQKTAAAFEAKTKIKVELFRSGGSDVVRRTMAELDAGRVRADVVLMTDVSTGNALIKRGALQPFKPEGFDKVIDGAKHPDGYWIAQRLQLYAIVVRHDKIAPADLPKSWADLTNPKYKGMLIMADPSYTVAAAIVATLLSNKFGWDYYKTLKNHGMMLVRGHEQQFTMMQQGERWIGAENNDPRVYNDGKEVPGLKTIWPTEGSIFLPSPFMIMKAAPRPNAAKLFAQFLLSPEAQKFQIEIGYHSARTDQPAPAGIPPLNEIPLMPIDFDHIEANIAGAKEKFAEIFQ